MILSQELVRNLFDYKDGVLYWRVSPSAGVKTGQKAGYTPKNKYAQVGIKGKLFYAHRIIYLYHHGVLPQEIDHIDLDRTNNKIENLRAATHANNLCNVRIKTNNTTGVKGVFLDKRRNTWYARVGKTYIGCFTELNAAEEAVKAAREKIHKEFTRHD